MLYPLLFAAAALAPLAAADDYAPLVLFDGAAARARGALCLDGSTPGMYFRPARDPAHDCTAIATTVQFVAREA